MRKKHILNIPSKMKRENRIVETPYDYGYVKGYNQCISHLKKMEEGSFIDKPYLMFALIVLKNLNTKKISKILRNWGKKKSPQEVLDCTLDDVSNYIIKKIATLP